MSKHSKPRVTQDYIRESISVERLPEISFTSTSNKNYLVSTEHDEKKATLQTESSHFKMPQKKKQLTQIEIKRAKEQLRQLKLKQKNQERQKIEKHNELMNTIVVKGKVQVAQQDNQEGTGFVDKAEASSSYQSMNKNLNRGTVGKYISNILKTQLNDQGNLGEITDEHDEESDGRP